jgi:actin-related protein
MGRLDVAGSDVTGLLMRLLRERGSTLSSTAEREIVRDMKERVAYVAQDFDAELAAAAREGVQEAYELPDGQVVMLGAERFRCTEALFQPELVGRDVVGLHRCVAQSVLACEVDLRRELFGHVCVSGGTSLLPGFAQRLTHEVTNLAPSGVRVSVFAPMDRLHGVWSGGSLLASLDTFQDMWVTRSDYAEFGAAGVCGRFF